MGSKLRRLIPLGIVAAALWFALRGQWPWRRLEVVPPSVVAQQFRESVDTLRRGETLSDLLTRQGLSTPEVPGLASRMGLDPRRLRAGLVFNFQRGLTDSIPSRVLVRLGPEERLALTRDSAGWAAEKQPVVWRAEILRVEGGIDNSLYEALDAGVSDDQLDGGERARLAWDLADVFAWEVDFSRDIRPGDRFEVAFERLVSEEGDIRFGRILAAHLVVGNRPIDAYRFDGKHTGHNIWFDGDGNSLHRAFLRAPLQFRRISSSFANSRYHPVLGYARRHEGTDYAAAPGTPVLAAGDGRVLRAGWSNGYGNLIEIRHKNGIETRYGHLRGFAAGVRSGSAVSQGQVIGYVGSTGLATGPHLHYEFRVNGVARDSRSVAIGNGEPIATADRPAFLIERDRLEALLAPPTGPPLSARATR
ncbi:MAG TPA: peptidoglycan DD-metalloendopeptidase family protein [Gemmatimonadales bacterium]|nr:peptidoglycan DD-metalloendopeptidase family protein [Gemmatimonadales bacterium]